MVIRLEDDSNQIHNSIIEFKLTHQRFSISTAK